MVLARLDRNGGSNGPAPAVREDTELPREVYALLAQANLLRMRGCWEEAVQNCMTALKLAPDNPAAQSLLGDIYENQGRVDDAAQWYAMALDASPDSPADRLKLDRLLQRRAPPAQPPRDSGPPAPAVPAGTLARLWQRMRDPETALRWGAGAAALVVCIVVLFAYSAVHRRAALAALGLAPDQEVKLQPVVVPPAATGAAPSAPSRDAAEQTVLASLNASTDLSAQGVTVDDVQFDPRASHVTLTFALGPAGSLIRAAVLRGALQAAQDAAAASPSAGFFTVRCLSVSGEGAASLVFVGDIARDALPASGTALSNEGAAPFTDPWWSPQIPS